MLPLSMTIDVGTLAYNYISREIFGRKTQASPIDEEYHPTINVAIPAYNEVDRLPYTINAILNQTYPVNKIYILDDISTDGTSQLCSRLQEENEKIVHVRKESKHGKAGNINLLVDDLGDELNDHLLVVDADVQLRPNCLENMISNYNGAEVTTGFGYTRKPTNFVATQLYEGERWINSVFSFRKRAQSMRNAVYVVCGALTMYETDVLKRLPIPERTCTEDTDYTWLLQENKIRINYVPSAQAIGGNPNTLKGYWKRYDRWFSGTFQNIYTHERDLNKNKSLLYTTIAPGLFEIVPYSFAISTLPATAYFYPDLAKGILAADFILSIPFFFMHPEGAKSAVKNLPGIYAFKYFGSVVGMSTMLKTTYQKLFKKDSEWKNTWESSSQNIVTPTLIDKKFQDLNLEKILKNDKPITDNLDQLHSKKWNLSHYIESNGDVAGLALVQKITEHDVKLETILVDNDYRHLDLDTKLFDSVIAKCKKKGIKNVYLNSENINKDSLAGLRTKPITLGSPGDVKINLEEPTKPSYLTKIFDRYVKIPVATTATAILLCGAAMVYDAQTVNKYEQHMKPTTQKQEFIVTEQTIFDNQQLSFTKTMPSKMETQSEVVELAELEKPIKKPQTNKPISHEVKEGDNLWKIIEEKLNLTEEDDIKKNVRNIVHLNEIEYPELKKDIDNDGLRGDLIKEGMNLKIRRPNQNDK